MNIDIRSHIMKKLICTTAVALVLGAGTAYADSDCNVPMTQWKSPDMLRQKLQGDGWKVDRIKTDDGCYEVHAVDDKGKRVEAKYDPKTFEVVELERKR
jgi:hypothetical protein